MGRVQYVLLIAALALFAYGGFLSYLDKTDAAVATYAAAVVCLIFVFLKQFSRFKAFGIEAELKEKIQEADVLLNQLRNLIAPISELLFTMVARAGRWDSAIPRKDSYRMMSQFEGQLAQLGVPTNTIEDAKKEWHQFNLLDLSRPIAEEIIERIHIVASEKQEIVNSFRGVITPDMQPAHTAAIEASRHVSAEVKRLKTYFSSRTSTLRKSTLWISSTHQTCLAMRKRMIVEIRIERHSMTYVITRKTTSSGG